MSRISKCYSLCLTFLLAATAISAFIMGCETMDKYSYKPEFQLTVNQIVKYPRASDIEKEISTITGEKIWINVNPLLHSSAIKKVQISPIDKEETGFDLILTLDHHGRLIWMQLSNQYSNDRLAFVIDGICYKTFTPELMTMNKDDEPIVRIKGPLDKTIAEKLAEYSEKNYGFYHKEK